MSKTQTIHRAFYDAQSRRPYILDPQILTAITPPGGDWICEAPEGHITRLVKWGPHEVALLNPHGDLPDVTEGQIAMAMRAMPAMDAGLRAIMVLAEDASNNDLIREICGTLIAHIEAPAPRFDRHEEEDISEDDEPAL